MSESGFKISVEIPDSVDNAVKNLTDSPSKSVGSTLGDCWFLVFGNLTQLAEKKRIKFEHELKLFKESLENEIDKIPKKNLVEPKSQIVMTALENAKFCVEEPEIRNMFAKLIASSVDSTKSDYVHPHYSEILKTMTPLDAHILLSLKEPKHLPLCDIKVFAETGSDYDYLMQNFFLVKQAYDDIIRSAQSISYLMTTGLIDSPFSVTITDQGAYDMYENSTYMKIQKAKFPNRRIELSKRIVQLTPAGKSFLSICCSD